MSQYHKYFRKSPFQRLINRYYRFKYEGINKNSYISKGTKLLRFPDNISVNSYTIIKNHCSLCVCNPKAAIDIGKNCTIGDYTYIYASKHIEIGDHSLIGPFCYIVDSNHSFRKNILIREQPLTTSNVKIGKDVWVGARTMILSGVEILDGAVIGAGSIVTRNVGENEIWAGVPAKKVGFRKL